MTAEIPSYQIHAVLQSLSRRLCGEQGAFPDRHASTELPATRSSEDRWLQTTIERVSDKIIDKITRLPSPIEPAATAPQSTENPAAGLPIRFVFHRLDEDQRKHRCIIPIEEANFLIAKKRN